MKNKEFQLINLIPDNQQYFPETMGKQNWMPDDCVKYSEIDLPLGHSRYGGCAMDLPEGINPPNNLLFAGQIDLSIASKFDKDNLLPKNGQLIFFCDIRTNQGQVIYTDLKNEQLKRTIVNHEENFFLGVKIKAMESGTESLDDYYKTPGEDELECWECGEENVRTCTCDEEIKTTQLESFNLNTNGEMWDSYKGQQKSKILGLYSHCQESEEQILKTMESDFISLFQIGENGFNDEGMFIVAMKKSDLENRAFDKCIFEWSQT